MKSSVSLNRRQFLSLGAGLAALGLAPAGFAAKNQTGDAARLHKATRQNAGRVGRKRITQIEGSIPKALNGSVYRVAPGLNNKFGKPLRHYFDGDAFLSAFHFENGHCTHHADYLATRERIAEQKAQKMLYHEFGTAAPMPEDPYADPPAFKNVPNVNVMHHDGRLLALSEGGAPIAVDPQTLAVQGEWRFKGTLPRMASFTAHPKFDHRSGEGFAFGIYQGDPLALVAFRMETDGRLKELHRVPLPYYAMIHDFSLTDQYMVFSVPPLYIDIAKLFQGSASCIAETLTFAEKTPVKYLVLRRDGTGEPIWIEDQPGMVFHNGNAREVDGSIVMDSIATPDDSVMKLLYSAAKNRLPEYTQNQLMRLRLDLVNKGVTRRDIITRGFEFPRFDDRRVAGDTRYLYGCGDHAVNHMLAGRLHAIDLHRGAVKTEAYQPHQALEEAVFVPRAAKGAENDGWLLLQGYDGRRNENFFDIRDAASLKRQARLWLGTHFPLGFHGNFVPAG
ncbi:carotenoid oxygenase family protein [Acanthopleuribacter pedis]|uniref:Carotenoid oxygenase family protein n=1 Tax=Acanthopleuribacter pedis TaxID=442870 RepID=A0A8J7QA72_9BACT|nr:carotenoid oxygenase family protein [Acanthopleuribacter pedis]MBO1320289.1 carotenoid oxygenase family protein [Acanthopleuribacter pedis]